MSFILKYVHSDLKNPLNRANEKVKSHRHSQGMKKKHILLYVHFPIKQGSLVVKEKKENKAFHCEKVTHNSQKVKHKIPLWKKTQACYTQTWEHLQTYPPT